MKFLRFVADAVLDRSPEELIGALLVASAIAVVMAGVYSLGGRETPRSPTFVGLLALAAGVSCMVLTAGYVEYATARRYTGTAATTDVFRGAPPAGRGRNAPPGPWGAFGARWSSGFHVVVAADEDHDGRLTSAEAARLVRKADLDGDGSVDFRDIDRVVASRFQPRFQLPDAPSPDATTRGARGEPSRGRDEPADEDSQDEKVAPKHGEPILPDEDVQGHR